MSLRELIMDHPTRKSFCSIEVTLTQNPELLKKLDRQAAAKLFRDASQSVPYPPCRNILDLLSAFASDMNPLIFAFTQGNLKLAESLLKKGARLDGPDWDDFSPMEYIFQGRNIAVHKDMVRLLLKYGFDPDIKDKGGENSLFKLARESVGYNTVEIAEILIEAGASVNQINEIKMTPVHIAIYKENADLVSFFIEKGAEIDQSHTFTYTPLNFAFLVRNEDVINLIISRGADDVNSVDCGGETALDKACRFHCRKVISFLIRKGADVSAGRIEVDDKTPFMRLDPTEDNYESCRNLMINEIAKLSFQNIQVSRKDLTSIQLNPRSRDYFEQCLSELKLMVTKKFYAPFSYYCVLKMSKNIKRLAHLTKNEEFLAQFEAKVGNFPNYQNELREIINEAKEVKDNLVAVESRLKFIFCNSLPDVVVRILTDELTLEDLPFN